MAFNKFSRAKRFSGFTLVETMMAIGIFAILAYGVSEVFAHLNKKAFVAEKKSEAEQMSFVLKSLVNNSETCSCHLKQMRFDLNRPNKPVDYLWLSYSCPPPPRPSFLAGVPETQEQIDARLNYEKATFVRTLDAVRKKGGQVVEAIYLTDFKEIPDTKAVVDGDEVSYFKAFLNVRPVASQKTTMRIEAASEVKLYAVHIGLNPDPLAMRPPGPPEDLWRIESCGFSSVNCLTPNQTGNTSTVPNGSEKKFYKHEVAPDCEAESQLRGCRVGVLSGSYEYSTCKSTDCVAPWGDRIPTGSSVKAYETKYAENCDGRSEERKCKDGDLSGSFKEKSCMSGTCKTPWGSTVETGQSVVAYRSDKADKCSEIKEVRVCSEGKLSGSYSYSSCTNQLCSLPWGGSIYHGDTVKSYDTPFADFCEDHQKNRLCSDGYLSDSSYSYKSCVSLGCISPWGTRMKQAERVTAYKTKISEDCDATGASEVRICTDGTLSGSFTEKTCVVPTCTTPWNEVINEGERVNAFSVGSSDDCNSKREIRTCHLGTLSGTFTHRSCNTIPKN